MARDSWVKTLGWGCVAVMLAGVLGAGPGGAGSQPATGPAVTLEQAVHKRIGVVLDGLVADGDWDTAIGTLGETFEEVIKLGSEKQLDLFRDADFALRLAIQMKQVDQDERATVLKYLRANDTLAHTLVFLVHGSDKPADVYKVLARLIAERGSGANAGQLEKYATLTAALCVVHQREVVRQINENATKSPEVVELFDYYSKNEAGMFFGIRGVPAELLTYVVDTTASVEDMKWAARKYGKDAAVGVHFFDVPYDYASFTKGTSKKINAVGYTLPNLLKYGGVCADQAYFACSVGKAIGVPTGYATGASATVGHAWVGFLQSDKGGWWNFNMGRYPEYQGVRGNVTEPQSGKSVPDSYVSLSAELIGTKAQNRDNAVALADAARLLVELGKREQAELAGDEHLTGVGKIKRRADVGSALEMVRLALRENPALAQGWFVVRDLAREGKLTTGQKGEWSDLLLKMCGKKYPDFALAVLEPMIESVDDPKEQNRLWNLAFNMFQGRADLAASIRMGQAQMWEAQNQTALAGQCYQDVIERYCNSGPFVLGALAGAEKLLRDSNKADRVVALYEGAWSKLTAPGKMASPFAAQSNWVRVGAMYAEQLAAAGQKQKAASVQAQVDAALGVAVAK